MKIGDSGESFVFVVMENSEDWIYCIDPNDKEYRYNTYNEAAGNAQDVGNEYEGKEVFILKESRVVMAQVVCNGGDLKVKVGKWIRKH